MAELNQPTAAPEPGPDTMGARLAELDGDAPPALAERLRVVEAELAQVRATKVFRYSVLPRRAYARLRGIARA
jgi:hypothetical protein